MTPATIGNFLLNNPVARNIALGVAFAVLLWFILLRWESRIRKSERRIIEIRAQKTAKKIHTEGEKDVENAIQAGRTANTVPSSNN